MYAEDFVFIASLLPIIILHSEFDELAQSKFYITNASYNKEYYLYKDATGQLIP
ncbi:hypothetical protein SAMN05216436_1521 [bacterium A37T11]|nr:hypothetical protein SAMN05216436_1521 [bacterium A37T11]